MNLEKTVKDQYGKSLHEVIKAICAREDFEEIGVKNGLEFYMPLFHRLDDLYGTGLFLPNELYSLLSKGTTVEFLRNLRDRVLACARPVTVQQSKQRLH